MTEFANITRREVEQLIEDYIFHERNRAILKRRMLDGIHFEPLAEEFDLSVRQVKNIVYKNQEIIFRHIPR